MSPPPRDLTKASALDLADIVEAVTHGRPGTAMAPFGKRLEAEEIAAVAAFVTREFLRCQGENGRYHSPENGWSAEDPETISATPFVTGLIPYDRAPARLTAEQRQGRAIFLQSCITCHEGRHYGAEEAAEEGELPVFAPVSSEQDPHSAELLTSSVQNEHANNNIIGKQGVEESEPEHFSEIYDRSAGIAAANEQNPMPLLEALSAEERRGQALYEESCQLCHARDGSGNNWIGQFLEPDASDLRRWLANSADLDDSALLAQIASGRPGSSMPDFGGVLPQADLRAILDYMRRAFATSDRPE